MASLTSLPHPQLLTCSTDSGSSSSCSSDSRFVTKREISRLPHLSFSSGRRKIQTIGVRATGVDSGRIGSRRRKGAQGRKDMNLPVDERRQPFLEPYIRRYREEGHQVLDDAESLIEKADNSFGLVLQIAAEANEYLRDNKDESLKRKPILKVISDRINETYGEQIRDCYLDEKPNYSEYES